jgi:hypothetical protein
MAAPVSPHAAEDVDHVAIERVVERFVVEEKLAEKGKALADQRLIRCVDLEDG